MNLKKKVNTDLFAAIVGFTVLAMFWGAKKGVGHLSIMFPNALLILVALFSTLLLVKAIVQADKDSIFASGDQKRVFITGTLLITWVLGIMFVGFLTTSLIMFPLFVCYLASARQKLTLVNVGLWSVISTLEVLVFYFIFSRFLQVPLPTGILI